MVSSPAMPFLNAAAQCWTRRILLAITVCLLAEQWAFAAHVCAGPASMPGCPMRMRSPKPGQGHLPRTAGAIACVAHCAAQPTAQPHPPTSDVPRRFDIALPTAPAIAPAMRSVRRSRVRTGASRAPPHFRTLLYCSLLI